MHTHAELVQAISNLADRAGRRLSDERLAVEEREFHQGERSEFRRSRNDAPLAALHFLEEIRRAAEDAQSALIVALSDDDSGPNYTEIGAALGVSKQSGRKRATAAAVWASESPQHELNNGAFTIENLAARYPAAGVAGVGAAEKPLHWNDDDTTIPPEHFGNTGDPQYRLANKAFAITLGASGSH